MKNIILLLFHILININFFTSAFAYLIIPFKTKKSIIDNTEHNITRLFRSLLYNNIYINLEIGEPKRTIETFLVSKDIDFYVSEKTKGDARTNVSTPDVDDVGCDLENFFDKDDSKSLVITDRIKSLYYGCKGYICYDNFYFKGENNNNIKENLEFILYQSTIGNRPAVIGLQFPRVYEDNNFFNILKKKDIITSYFWMINYTSEYEGNFIIGEQPHKFDPGYYKEDDLIFGHPYTYSAMQEYWGLRMDDILFQDNNFRPNHECYFYHELNYISGISELEKEIDKYFNDSINITCFKEKIKYPYGPHKFYYCDKEKYKNKVKYFPPLRFLHKEMNYTFELTYEDLFIEKYDKLILLIFFEQSGITWKLGKPFLKKYPFIMNHDMKVVGLYKSHSKQKSNKGENNGQDNYLLTISLIGLGVIILIVCGIFMGKYLFKKKKRLNTLDDEYDYSEAKNQNIINE
jgi:hypothetical protein